MVKPSSLLRNPFLEGQLTSDLCVYALDLRCSWKMLKWQQQQFHDSQSLTFGPWKPWKPWPSVIRTGVLFIQPHWFLETEFAVSFLEWEHRDHMKRSGFWRNLGENSQLCTLGFSWIFPNLFSSLIEHLRIVSFRIFENHALMADLWGLGSRMRIIKAMGVSIAMGVPQ